MQQVFTELSQLSTPTLAAIGALAGALGAILAAIITGILGKLIVTPFLGARDKQDREVEWRKHAIELTKLDLERKLKTRKNSDTTLIRPSILDFLANYRDLQELGEKTPKELYEVILKKRINAPAGPAPLPQPEALSPTIIGVVTITGILATAWAFFIHVWTQRHMPAPPPNPSLNPSKRQDGSDVPVS